MIKIIAWDLETTGRLSEASPRWEDQPGITQIGASCIEYIGEGKYATTSKLNTYIDPELPDERWHAEAVEKTGIGPDTVKDAPNLLMAHAEVAGFFVGATYSLTYNGEWFDYIVLKHQLERYGLATAFPWPPCHIDLMKPAADWYEKAGKRGIKRPTLEELYEVVMGRTFENAHDALADVDALVEIFVEKGGLQGLGYE